ncbi:hypothetical protein DPMN_108191 [Dreissena polymorpha]|uniref:Alpha-macroglobulin-like TED domain-containing protein n=1 Tax=Dreissena polymorpha TaxID=45954 RepID=A0A9D4K8B4_DREPO|nr:hypothetical protein DPMN_108191 [Dreissena polymorpha]
MVSEGSGQVHWERDNAEKVPASEMWWYRASSAEVVMTAYVMMSMLTSSGGAYETAPIVQWLTRQRNSYGGFSSTQVTFHRFLVIYVLQLRKCNCSFPLWIEIALE